jgi:hypothetical protein
MDTRIFEGKIHHEKGCTELGMILIPETGFLDDCPLEDYKK